MLGVRASLIALASSFFFLFLSSSLFYYHEFRRQASMAEKEVGLLYEAQAPGMVEALWDYDSELLEVLVDGLGCYPYINYVGIRDHAGPVVERGARKKGGVPRDYPLRRQSSSGMATDLGTLSVEIDAPMIKAGIRSQVFLSALFQVSFLVAQSLLVVFLFWRMVTSHLATMAAYIREYEVRPGMPPLLLRKRGRGDELDQLAQSFNTMRAKLESARESELRAMEDVARSLREKEVLIQEIYHRTKNNMQLIASFLSMEAMESGDQRIKAILGEMIGRITSMALVHEKLYESGDLSRLDFGEYLEDLVSDIVQASLDERRGIAVSVEASKGIVLPLEAAIPCGLALNEVIVNAVKHAFPGGRRGCLRVGLARGTAGDLVFTVADDGAGFPPGFDPRRDGHIGLQTVFALVENQLHGSLGFGSGPEGGVTCTVTIAEPPVSRPLTRAP